MLTVNLTLNLRFSNWIIAPDLPRPGRRQLYIKLIRPFRVCVGRPHGREVGRP